MTNSPASSCIVVSISIRLATQVFEIQRNRCRVCNNGVRDSRQRVRFVVSVCFVVDDVMSESDDGVRVRSMEPAAIVREERCAQRCPRAHLGDAEVMRTGLSFTSEVKMRSLTIPVLPVLLKFWPRSSIAVLNEWENRPNRGDFYLLCKNEGRWRSKSNKVVRFSVPGRQFLLGKNPNRPCSVCVAAMR